VPEAADPEDLPWLPGERYAPHSVLGDGGTAVVYLAYDHDRKAWVAVKLLRQRNAKNQRARQRFLDEARVLESLQHRNVIEILDVVGEAARPFIVMELAEGGSLMQWSRAHGAMPPRLAVDVAMQICKGAGAAHKIGVIHRDLKPHNILLTRRGVCKVTDFGIAQLPRRDGTTDIPDAIATTGSGVSGTLGYMAPEQRKDPRSVDPRTDVYGIGATLYTLLTAQTVVDLFVAEREPALLASVPEALAPLLRKATAYRVEDRYLNVVELAKALFEVRDQLPDDPLDAPALITEAPPDPTPPPRPPREAPEVVPSDTGAFRRKPSTTPPTNLRTFEPIADDRRKTPPRPMGMGGRAAIGAALVAALAAGTVGAGAVGVRTARASAEQSQGQLYHKLDAELAIVDDLGAVGADGEQLERLYKEQREVDAKARPWVSARYVEALQRDVREHAQATQADAAKARERMARIDAADAEARADLARWSDRAAHFPGSLAVRWGLAEGP
jgi:serine/threonine protein kinase